MFWAHLIALASFCLVFGIPWSLSLWWNFWVFMFSLFFLGIAIIWCTNSYKNGKDSIIWRKISCLLLCVFVPFFPSIVGGITTILIILWIWSKMLIVLKFNNLLVLNSGLQMLVLVDISWCFSWHFIVPRYNNVNISMFMPMSSLRKNFGHLH